MRILYVVHGYHPAVGGTQWVIQNLAERMVAHYGDAATVFTTTAYSNSHFWRTDQPAMQPGVEEINGVTVRRFPAFNRFGKARFLAANAARRLRLPYYDWLLALYNGPLIRGMTSEIERSGADVIVASAFPLLHMHYALWGAERGAIPLVYIGAIHAADDWGYDRPMIYNAIKRANAYVAYTAFERDLLVERRIDSSRICVVGAGVDPSLYAAADGRAFRSRRGWGDEPIVAIVAQHAPHKRIDDLIQAMRQVWQTFPSARLCIAGARTGYSTNIDGYIASLMEQEQDRVTQISDFLEEDKPNLYAACDVLVNPSAHESFGLVFIEAWACAKPVIGVRVGAVPSVVEAGRDGLLVDYGDTADLAHAIIKLLADPSLRERLGEAGRSKVIDRYTWKSVVPRFREVFSRVIAQ